MSTNIRTGFVDRIGNTPLIRLGALRRHGLRDPRQGRVHEPGRLGEGPGRAGDRPGRGAPRPAPARRDHRRGHGGQYRHRARGRRQLPRLPDGHRDAGQPEQDKVDTLRPTARTSAGAGGARSRTRTTSCTRRGGSRRNWRRAAPNGAVWANQFDNVANRGLREPRPGDLGPDGRPRGRLHLLGRHRRHAGRHRPGPRARNPAVQIGLADPQGSALYNYFTAANSRRRAARSAKASAPAGSRPISPTRRWSTPSRSRTASPSRWSTT